MHDGLLVYLPSPNATADVAAAHLENDEVVAVLLFGLCHFGSCQL